MVIGHTIKRLTVDHDSNFVRFIISRSVSPSKGERQSIYASLSLSLKIIIYIHTHIVDEITASHMRKSSLKF